MASAFLQSRCTRIKLLFDDGMLLDIPRFKHGSNMGVICLNKL